MPKYFYRTVLIRNNTRRLISLTEEILEFRKAETGNLKLVVDYGDLRVLILQIASGDFQTLIRKRSLTLNIDCESEPIMGYFDSDKITKILYNLFSNAYKYNIDGGEIYLCVEALDYDDNGDCRSVKVAVTNTGGVITPEQQKSLFKRFYDGAYRQFGVKGVGIGLSLTKELVVLHRGEISVTSDELNGTTFTFTIPLSKDSYDANQIQPQESRIAKVEESCEEVAATESEASVERSTQKLILLVEDETDCAYVVNAYLSRRYIVELASNGADALQILQSRDNIDIVVSDVMMPLMDVYELCREIKSDIATSHIPVILLSAKGADESKVEGLNCGAEVYLTKPVEMSILEAQVASLLKSREMLAQRLLRGEVSASIVDSDDYTSQNQQFMIQVISVIKENLSNYSFDVKDLEEALSVTRSTLYRKIKSQVDLSPLEFIRHIRLQCAREIILSKGNDVTIAEVAYHTGFNTPHYFSRCFKKEFGVSPSQLLDRPNNQQTT